MELIYINMYMIKISKYKLNHYFKYGSLVKFLIYGSLQITECIQNIGFKQLNLEQLTLNQLNFF